MGRIVKEYKNSICEKNIYSKAGLSLFDMRKVKNIEMLIKFCGNKIDTTFIKILFEVFLN